MAKEILTTEQTYVDRVQTLVDVFVKPLTDSLSSNDPICPQADIATIFGTIEDILQLNKRFLHDLSERITAEHRVSFLDLSQAEEEAYAPVRLGDLMLQLAPHLSIYSTYVNNMENANNFLIRVLGFGENSVCFSVFCCFREWQLLNLVTSSVLQGSVTRRYERLVEFIKQCEQNERCNKQNLQSFLILPVQRIPRYKLLLAEVWLFFWSGQIIVRSTD